jgi:hypothetical protein
MEPSFGATPVLADSEQDDVKDTLLERQSFMELLKHNLTRAQTKMNSTTNNRRSERTF